jgi:hypothetical protein
VDEIVIRSMAKWPDVPNVYGWLALDRRGQWLVKSRAGGFERISNPAVVEFINRNYQADATGRWFFQNGPQRVFVALRYTPLVYRIEQGGAQLVAHTGMAIERVNGAWLDERGALLLQGDAGVGVLSDRDLGEALALMRDEHGRVPDEGRVAALVDGSAESGLYLHLGPGRAPVDRISSSAVAGRFGFVAEPRPPAGQPDC